MRKACVRLPPRILTRPESVMSMGRISTQTGKFKCWETRLVCSLRTVVPLLMRLYKIITKCSLLNALNNTVQPSHSATILFNNLTFVKKHLTQLFSLSMERVTTMPPHMGFK